MFLELKNIENISWMIKNSQSNWLVKLKHLSDIKKTSINLLFPLIFLIQFENFACFSRWTETFLDHLRWKIHSSCLHNSFSKFISKNSEQFRNSFWEIWNIQVKMAKFREICKNFTIRKCSWKVVSAQINTALA